MRQERQNLRDHPDLAPALYPIVVDLHLEHSGGRAEAKDRVRQLVAQAIQMTRRADGGGGPTGPAGQGIAEAKTEISDQYVFATLTGAAIRTLVRLDNQQTRAGTRALSSTPGAASTPRAIYRIWPDFPLKALIIKSISTVKADAARFAFSARGQDVVWAVMDSGIDADHPHFAKHQNLVLNGMVEHLDFTALGGENRALVDAFGHGTHVAGIIAGELTAADPVVRPAAAPVEEAPPPVLVPVEPGLPGAPDAAVPGTPAGQASGEPGKLGEPKIRAFARYRDEQGNVKYDPLQIDAISGMAPRCKLVSLKVLDDKGDGVASNLIAAIEYVQQVNDYGRRLRIHGVNMSVGYAFEPEWFACGQSPLCVEVDRLVRSGVSVVDAAGNTGYGYAQSAAKGAEADGIDLTINDPGNADLAITVGSTHREMPHVYGVSYFSSKGPTGDGRPKPDLVAPGEKILSCAAGAKRQKAKDKTGQDCDYVEDSGTSMAAPHVSGVIAAFLSVRREFIGQPERVKDIFLSSATDLRRERSFQGRGLVDLMRAIQSV
jgi:subtilisin family serine protease